MYLTKVIAFVLVITGAINWGLIGFFGFDLISAIFGDMSIWSRIIYSLVGISALIMLVSANTDVLKREEM